MGAIGASEFAVERRNACRPLSSSDQFIEMGVSDAALFRNVPSRRSRGDSVSGRLHSILGLAADTHRLVIQLE
jgi:hypothetical protein